MKGSKDRVCAKCGEAEASAEDLCPRCVETTAAITSDSSPADDDGSSPGSSLRVVSSAESVVDIELRGVVEVGRAAPYAIVDRRLSRAHFEVSRFRGGHVLRDLASRNGTYVNGRRVASTRLLPGDVIRAGDTVFVYAAANPQPGRDDLLGRSAVIAETVRALTRLATSDVSVLLEGETGTGKEVAAHTLHRLSGRAGPLIATNVGAMPETLFESELFGHVRGAFTGAATDARGLMASAEGGTLFLDEIAELSLGLQVKLLRALETRTIRPVGAAREVPCDVRLVAATNARLSEAVSAGKFRADLYARLAEATVRLPRLSARLEDLPLLARHFFAGVTPTPMPRWAADFTEALCLYAWPMNVRELRALVRRLAALYPGEAAWTLAMLPEEMRARVASRDPGAAEPASAPTRNEGPIDAELMREALRATGGNVRRAAASLSEERTRFYRRMRELGLRLEDFRGARTEDDE